MGIICCSPVPRNGCVPHFILSQRLTFRNWVSYPKILFGYSTRPCIPLTPSSSGLPLFRCNLTKSTDHHPVCKDISYHTPDHTLTVRLHWLNMSELVCSSNKTFELMFLLYLNSHLEQVRVHTQFCCSNKTLQCSFVLWKYWRKQLPYEKIFIRL